MEMKKVEREKKCSLQKKIWFKGISAVENGMFLTSFLENIYTVDMVPQKLSLVTFKCFVLF